jgi:hypothetical protein
MPLDQARACLCEAYLHWGSPACANAVRNKHPNVFSAASPDSPSALDPSTTASRAGTVTTTDRSVTTTGPLGTQLDATAMLRADEKSHCLARIATGWELCTRSAVPVVDTR